MANPFIDRAAFKVPRKEKLEVEILSVEKI